MKKIFLITVIIALITVSPGFSQTQVPDFDITVLQSTMDDFSGNLARSLPFSSAIGLNWSDAYIGNFPHFGVGFSLGFTTMDGDSFEELINMFHINMPEFVAGFGGFPIPGYTAEARLGGFVLPFDVGFKFGYLPLKPQDIRLDYFLVGGDVRYALVKETLILPAISVGAGFNYMTGAFGRDVGQEIRYNYGDDGHYISVGAPEISIDWSTASLDFKAQISKSLVFFTPYLGFGASTGWSKTGYSVEAEIEDSNNNLEEAIAIFKALGIADLSETGFSSEQGIHGWGFRLFGGFSFNIALIKLDFTGFWNFNDKYGVSFGTRFQF